MDKLLKISEKTNIVLHALIYIDQNKNDLHSSVKKMAHDIGISPTYLAKVLQPLVREGILLSLRGANGGFSLNKPAEEIIVLDIITSIEGNLPEHSCLLGKPVCEKGKCIFTDLNDEIKSLLLKKLSGLSLADLRQKPV